MNTIYRIVWNAAFGKWVVASELAKGRKKKSHRSMASFIALTAAVAGLGVTGYASAQTLGSNVTQGNSGNVVLGDNAMGAATCIKDNSVPTAACDVVIGNSASAAAGNSVVIGDHASTTANASTAIGSYATADKYSQAIGAGANASGGWATAIGQSAQATSTNTTAIGTNATATLDGATAIGSSAHANGQNSFALGRNSNAATEGSMAFGYGVTSTGADAIALGSGASADADYSIAIGSSASTQGAGAIAIGQNASIVGGSANAIAIGTGATASMANSLAIGSNAASATESVALGDGAKARNQNDTAVGAGATASLNSTAVGQGAAAVSGSTAVGVGATTTFASNAVALGAGSSTMRNNTVAVGAAGSERQIVNLAAGVQGTDAVNVSQLKPVVAGLGGGATINSTTGAVTGPTYNVQGATQTNVGDALDALDGGLKTAQGDIATINNQIGNMGDTLANAVMYDDSTHGSVTLGGASAAAPVTLHNVAAGALDAGSTDAVNGSQLYATNQQVATNTTNINNLDGRVTTVEGDVSHLYDQVNQGGIGLVQQAASGANLTVGKDTDGAAVDFADKNGNARTLSNVSAGMADTDAVNVSQLKSSGLIDANGNAMAAVTYDRNVDGTANYNSITLGGGKSSGPVAIHNVAAGTEDTDAVNVGQLKTAGLVDSDGNTLDAVVYDPGSNRGSVTLGGVGAAAPVVLTNVANGQSQYDAVNFGQLTGVQSDLQNQINTMNSQVTNIDGRVTNLEGTSAAPVSGGGDPGRGSSSSVDYAAASPGSESAAPANVGSSAGSVAVGYNATATGNGSSAAGQGAAATGSSSTAIGAGATASADNSVALGAGSVATQANSVSVGSAGNERTITNVASGVNATDAVNVSQLQASQNWAKSYVDQTATQLNNRINTVGRHADAGTAAAMAMSNIPQAYQPNQSSLGAGIGTFNGQAAVAVGMSTITPGGRWVLKGSLTGNSQGDVGVGFGASMVW
ncbi:MAG TPA: YadA-like family protein [Dyella sp.]|nr:YadA-like family protein [Dyella sp.]